MMTAISVKNLSVSYSGFEAINGISLDVNNGDFLCIIGPNGGGKTTLLNTILGFLKPDNGEVLIGGKSSTKISYVPQTATLDRNFPISVLETVLTGTLGAGLHPFRRFTLKEKQQALKKLSLVGLESYAKRQISELSGGEFQRLLIARALALNPEILLLDEPTANVDMASRDKIFSLLVELSKQGLTIITVTHDLKAAAQSADKIAFIDQKLKYYGEPVSLAELTALMYGESEVE